MKAKPVALLACAAALLLLALEARAAVPSKAKQEELLSALIAINFGNVYFEDGAAKAAPFKTTRSVTE